MQRGRHRSAYRRYWASWTCVAAAAALLSACGGGGGGDQPAKITTVKVMGDSLADSGTFGYKFTVQSAQATGAGSAPLWVDHIASQYGTSLCARYVRVRVAFGVQPACTNYAVGGGRINNTQSSTEPYSIPLQLRDAAAQGYGEGDLVLVDGGANDASDLVGAYLGAAADPGAFQGLLLTQLDAATVQALLAQGAAGQVQAGGAYMQALAKNWAATIRSHTVDHGAPRVAVLNIPDISLTPRFRSILQAVAAQQGSAAAQQVQAIMAGWLKAFNQQLASSLAGDARVTVVDFYAELGNQVAQPSKYGYTNVTAAVCPSNGTDAQGLPLDDIVNCRASDLSAQMPAGATSSQWWQGYMFADSFHPSPSAHAQLGKAVSASLARAGW